MKKKTLKKLVLAKETVKNLGEEVLSKAAGGSQYVCPATEYNTCWRFCQIEPER